MADAQRTSSYPIQSSDWSPSSPVPSPSKRPDPSTRIPSSIRALKDARHADGHTRTVVLCLDGTGDRFDNDNSNVVHFVSCLKKDSPSHQVTYYQSGIGTYGKGGLKDGIGAAMDMAVGSGLGIHIKDAYRFLMQNYREGDKICLLGFSRGAYTVRCLVGMLHKVGLLPASNGAQVNFAYDFFKDDTPHGWKMSADFKKTFCNDVDVYFVGLWDCVASVGFIPRKLPFSKSPTNSIHYFRHAMALDEHRAKFKVSQWQHQNPDLKRSQTIDKTPGARVRRDLERVGLRNLLHRHEKPSDNRGHAASDKEKQAAYQNGMTNSANNGANGAGTDFSGNVEKASSDSKVSQDDLEASFNEHEAGHGGRPAVETDALEVWFMGAHADIGGGAVHNDKRHKISQIPLRWMLRQCFECDTGILFHSGCLADQGLDVHTLYPEYYPHLPPSCGPPPALEEKYEKEKLPPLRWRRALLRIGDSDDEETKNPLAEEYDKHHVSLLSEATENCFDARAPVNDQLEVAKFWWILEAWPVKVRLLTEDGLNWEKKVRLNMGKYRPIRESEPNLHWTVQRMVDEGKYTIKGRTNKDTRWQIVS